MMYSTSPTAFPLVALAVITVSVQRQLLLLVYADCSCRRIASPKLLSEHRELPAQSFLGYGVS